MNAFWSIAALLVIAVVGSLLPASLRARGTERGREAHRALHARRIAELKSDAEDEVIDPADLAAAEDEITRALLEEAETGAVPADRPAARWLTVAAVVACVPAVAMLTYLHLGKPTLAGERPQADHPATVEGQSIDALLANLKRELEQDPERAEGWLLLGRSYMALNRYGEAVGAFERAHALVGDMPRVMLQYADALAMANNGRIGRRALDLVERALTLEPDNIVALWLGGLGAAESGERDVALERLYRARGLSEARGAPTDELDSIIAGLGGETVAARAPEPASAAPPDTAGKPGSAAITVHVELDPALAANVSDTDTLFVFARTDAAGPPLAVARDVAAALPQTFVLDETMAMAPRFRLQPGAVVRVTARISSSGTPTAESGDVQGSVENVMAGQAEAVTVVISELIE